MMSQLLLDDSIEKVDAYFDIIDWYIVDPIMNSDLNKSCIATLLLIFSAVDGLGKLIHPNSDSKPGERFRNFLHYMGRKYEQNAEKIWELRNSLVHNALNTVSYMASIDMNKKDHLSRVRVDGLLFVETNLFAKHFFKAKDRVKKLILNDEMLLKSASARLEWIEEDIDPHLSLYSTPPPPVRFIHER